MSMMNDKVFLKKLQEFQEMFSLHFGVASLVVDDEGNALTKPTGFTNFCKMIRSTEKGGKLCRDSKKNLFDKVADGEAHTYHCSIFDELADSILPIMDGDEVVACVAVGQKRVADITRERVTEVANDIGLDPDEFWQAYLEVPYGTMEEFERGVYFLNNTIGIIMAKRTQDVELAESNDKLLKFINITAHDLREDLGIIVGYCELLHGRYSDVLDPDAKDFVDYIYDNSISLKNTAQRLMNAARGDKYT